MILISHRGNLNGRNAEEENRPDTIMKALDLGLQVEIDVWLHNNDLYLGHDEPTHKTSIDFISQPNIWVHAKNKLVIPVLKKNKNVHWFWHENDKVALTSKGYVWCFPGHEVECGIAVDAGQTIKNCLGICSDNILAWSDHGRTHIIQ